MAIAIEKIKATFGKSAVLAGLTAGLVFLVIELLLVSVFTADNAWAPVSMIAAIIMGKEVLPEAGMPATFDLVVFLIALALHFTLSIFYTGIIGMLCKVRHMASALSLGATCGLAIYLINFYGFTALFPWFAMARNWISILAHLVFGITAAYMFVKIHYPYTSETPAGAQMA